MLDSHIRALYMLRYCPFMSDQPASFADWLCENGSDSFLQADLITGEYSDSRTSKIGTITYLSQYACGLTCKYRYSRCI